jgi:hypothetical protein
MLGVQQQCLQAMCERELLLGDVATCRSRFGGRPRGLGSFEAVDRAAQVARVLFRAHRGIQCMAERLSPTRPYAYCVELECSTCSIPDRWCLEAGSDVGLRHAQPHRDGT